MSHAKLPLTDLVFREWDVARRTAEFFDEQIGRLRGIGITASVAILGIAAQYLPVSGVFLLPLNVGFLLMDRRFQNYLVAVTEYAQKIEETYAFVDKGLTNSIRTKTWVSLRKIFYFLYLTFIIASLYFLVPLASQFLSNLIQPKMDP